MQTFQHPALSALEHPGAKLLALEIICVNSKLPREAGKTTNSVEENRTWS